MSKVAGEKRAEGTGTRNLWTQEEELLLAECYIHISEDPNVRSYQEYVDGKVDSDESRGPSSRLFFLQVRFVFLSFILFTFSLSLHHLASGSQTVGDDVVPKFDMNVYTSVLTFDEVKSLVAEYAIPLDLHPCVPPSGLTMNRLPAD
ncbi:hypothetical protein Tco_0705651 [Tanacetum coccineum]|uniref:Myb-like domain-containing protein n=1 Tax=Tanacetum coccineum TaxID=301880 RepID=A0ABQ4Y575_9ASTR